MLGDRENGDNGWGGVRAHERDVSQEPTLPGAANTRAEGSSTAF